MMFSREIHCLRKYDWFVKLQKRNFFRTNFLTCKTYTKTILLPKTKFPPKVTSRNRLQWDKNIEKEAKFAELYLWQQENNKYCNQVYILHDGPPYANGKVHLGHAINKILKDIIVRLKILQGFQVHYVPGWDCHGLPIELKAVKTTEKVSSLEIRKKSYAFAMETVQEQMKEFKSWGLVGDWDNAYRTSNPEYICQQLRAFYTCYKKGLIYQDFKPVYWSPSSKTALAEAELEYYDHMCISAYIEFPVKTKDESLFSSVGNRKVSLLCWTTNPWTLPDNHAICFSPDSMYAIVEHSSTKRLWIIAVERLEYLQELLNAQLEVLTTFRGDALKSCTYTNPLSPSVELPVLEASHVTMSKGTGLVHTAPNHGLEDYFAVLQNGITRQKCLVDEEGKFLSDVGEELAGQEVLGSGNEMVLKLLKENLVHSEPLKHSYPFDWRTKQPIINRASKQWFMSLEKIKNRALSSLDEVTFHPPTAKDMLRSLVENRPDWCISRQRSWGVPIPAFFMGEKKEVVINKDIIEYLCHLLRKEGNNFWWSLDVRHLLPREVLEKSNLPVNETYEASTDIMDIWFDSGISWNAVLPEPQVSDLYLEGIDQLRGWFQSSLLTSIALRDQPPYKSVYMHGFALDSEGRKMSKSLNNVIEPSTIVEGNKNSSLPYGVDVLRWWVAYQGSGHKNIAVSQQVIQDSKENVDKVRLVAKFLLGGLNGYDHQLHQCPLEHMKNVDKYMLHILNEFCNDVNEFYNAMKFNSVVKRISYFVVNDLSAIYFSAIKDRLYCEKEESLNRRSCQTVLYHVLENLVKAVAPVVPHLAEEICLHFPQMGTATKGAFHRGWIQTNAQWDQTELCDVFNIALAIRDGLTSLYLKTNLRDLELIVITSKDVISHLQALHHETMSQNSDLCELLQVARVTVTDQQPEEICEVIATKDVALQLQEVAEDCKLLVTYSATDLCDRCRRRTVTTQENLCNRCRTVLEDSNARNQVAVADK